MLLAGSRDDSFVTKGSLGMRAHPRGLNYKLNLLMHEKIRFLTCLKLLITNKFANRT